AAQGGGVGDSRDLFDQGAEASLGLAELPLALLQGGSHTVEGFSQLLQLTAPVLQAGASAQVPGSELASGAHQGLDLLQEKDVPDEPGCQQGEDCHNGQHSQVREQGAIAFCVSDLRGQTGGEIASQ